MLVYVYTEKELENKYGNDFPGPMLNDKITSRETIIEVEGTIVRAKPFNSYYSTINRFLIPDWMIKKLC